MVIRNDYKVELNNICHSCMFIKKPTEIIYTPQVYATVCKSCIKKNDTD